jgi:hypothetical protein
MVKTDDPVEQRVHRENADRMLLASFVAGLTGVVGKQVCYSAPRSMQQALSLALSVQGAENQEKFNESFFAMFDNSVKLVSRENDRTYREDGRPRRSADEHATRPVRGQHSRVQPISDKRSTGKPTTSGTSHA